MGAKIISAETAACYPPTPIETPHDRIVKQEPATQPRPSRFADDYDESMEETIKPVRGSKSSRASGIFQDMRQQAEALAQKSLMQTPAAPASRSNGMGFVEAVLGTPGFMNMANISAEFVKIESGGFEELGGSFSSDLPSSTTTSSSSHHASPVTPHHQQQQQHRHHIGGGNADFGVHSSFDFDSQATATAPDHGYDQQQPGGQDEPGTSPRSGSLQHRRTDSMASVASAASIASINIEETKTDTGVTLDDIAAYIKGPEAVDGKWVCIYGGCLKRFGRKENIKSHVQTHLNDRQYQCPTCRKCFVRQHDLKRHAKIHTGIKPYPCECGNSFARHDALTRHRQRGMCIGAFDGIVRKVVKRGRPRKNRPDLDERRDKSDRTRRKNASGDDTAITSPTSNSRKHHASVSSVSSFSGYSDCSSSVVSSPVAMTGSFDDLMDDEPFPDLLDVAISELPHPSASSASSSSSSPATIHPSSLAVSSAPMPMPMPMQVSLAMPTADDTHLT